MHDKDALGTALTNASMILFLDLGSTRKILICYLCQKTNW